MRFSNFYGCMQKFEFDRCIKCQKKGRIEPAMDGHEEKNKLILPCKLVTVRVKFLFLPSRLDILMRAVW